VKRVLALVACLVAASSLGALDLSFGADLSYQPRWESYSETAGDPRISRSELVFGAFLDAEYLLLEVYYARGVGDETTVTTSAGVDVAATTENGYAAYQLGLLGKYPVALPGCVLSPMGGLRCRIGQGDDGGTGELLLAAGLGVELPIARPVYVRPRALVSFPVFSDPATAGDYFGWALDLGLAIGFRSE
jgi:hypothetical protein